MNKQMEEIDKKVFKSFSHSWEEQKRKLNKVMSKFISGQDALAKKYGIKASISFEGKEVVIADHTDKSK